MFKQFIHDIHGDQVYLIISLGIFMLFFIVVTIMLMRILKERADYMSNIPLDDNDKDEPLNNFSYENRS